MDDRFKHPRNIAIVLALALVVYAVPGGAAAGGGISNLLSVILFAGIAFFGYRLYMEHRITLLDLPSDQRTLLYGSATLLVVAFLCTSRMWNAGSGVWILLWFALIGIAAAGAVSLTRRRREL